MAVEFDTYYSSDFEDPSHNHISVNTGYKEVTTANHNQSISSTSKIPQLNDSRVHTAKVVYDPNTSKMQVFVDNLDSPSLSFHFDLSKVFDGDCWVGFTASTGGICQSHSILSWKLQSFSSKSVSCSVIETPNQVYPLCKFYFIFYFILFFIFLFIFLKKNF